MSGKQIGHVTAHSDDGRVEATATAFQEITHVRVKPTSTSAQAEAGIVQAVNRALEGSNSSPDTFEKQRRKRVSEFNDVLEGLSNDVARTRSSMRR